MVVIVIVNTEIAINKLTKEELIKLYDEGKNLSGKPIFITFYATWCGPCKMFEQVLNEVTPEYSDKINFYKVDIEEEPEIASLFRVMSVPQVSMIRKDGSKEQEIGVMNEGSLKYWLEGLISN